MIHRKLQALSKALICTDIKFDLRAHRRKKIVMSFAIFNHQNMFLNSAAMGFNKFDCQKDIIEI